MELQLFCSGVVEKISWCMVETQLWSWEWVDQWIWWRNCGWVSWLPWYLRSFKIRVKNERVWWNVYKCGMRFNLHHTVCFVALYLIQVVCLRSMGQWIYIDTCHLGRQKHRAPRRFIGGYWIDQTFLHDVSSSMPLIYSAVTCNTEKGFQVADVRHYRGGAHGSHG